MKETETIFAMVRHERGGFSLAFIEKNPNEDIKFCIGFPKRRVYDPIDSDLEMFTKIERVGYDVEFAQNLADAIGVINEKFKTSFSWETLDVRVQSVSEGRSKMERGKNSIMFIIDDEEVEDD
jgi:hypothetical protein|nr:MAG TPA: E2F/DP family winged-helix DNA-binding domain protein [Caudoviricetes sp.]